MSGELGGTPRIPRSTPGQQCWGLTMLILVRRVLLLKTELLHLQGYFQSHFIAYKYVAVSLRPKRQSYSITL